MSNVYSGKIHTGIARPQIELAQDRPTGPLIAWVNLGSEGWHFRNATTVEEALAYVASMGTQDWVLTRGRLTLVAQEPTP